MKKTDKKNGTMPSPNKEEIEVQEQSTSYREQIPIKHPHGESGKSNEQTPRKHPHDYTTPVDNKKNKRLRKK